MSKTRSHVDSRIRVITDILAPESAATTPSVPTATPSEFPRTSSSSRTAAVSSSTVLPAAPPSYEEVIMIPDSPPSYTQSQSSVTPSYTQSQSAMRRSETSDSVTSQQGEILFSMSGVQVFHVSPGGEVTTPSYPETLHVVRLDQVENINTKE